MTKDLRPKVSNFVYGRDVEERSDYIVTNSRYETPEVLPPDANEHTCLSDIWSYGVLLWQLQTEKKPYGDDDDEAAKYKIKNEQLLYMTNDEDLIE
ncbi:hypothetical protein RclHR1_00110033 [Rhizophagus clarus]|uniref:Protein kinase domain-containing protein n=1 Tax=Rhizophagus clarus TaxID=94130 RepID=A0A2Z6Q343_9GLOM|nr:hypothetical protein RclHR1_00110033 [Rhizophagus clarus]